MFTPPPSPRPIPVDTGSLTLESEASSSSRGRQSLSPDVSDRLSPSPSRSHREKRPPSIILTPPDEDMVSPLPSPLPALVVSSKEIPLSLSPAEKKRIGARTRLVSLVLVPLVLILITYTTRALSHPIALDIFSPSSEASWSSASDWSIHKRHPSPDSGSGSGQNSSTSLLFPTGGSATPTTTAASSTNSGGSALVPTVPADAPVLPTPFPQALDTTLGQNFTTKNCQDFFANMTQSVAFRSCRPLSLLIHSSSAFIDAQSNLTLYNDLIWGTCNTRTAVDQCNTNIDWFRDTLQSACATELSGRNALATTTLTGLQAYSLMRQAGCLVNPSTNTYCLLDAVRATTASDIYYYGLPLGTPLPAGMTPTCSACSKSLLSLFAPSAKASGASGNTTATLPALGNGVYSRAASVANAQCGQEFAVGASNGGNSVSRPASWLMALTALVMAIIAL